ncbi:DUF3987 domain-containing protein [Anabaena minutissima FACHB-250]|nr:DUF3987 domain-containing protein [Anabaena minutissima FACHB-250]
MVAQFAENADQAPNTVPDTINWVLRLGRPPLPENPIEAAKVGKEPKAPCYYDGRRVIPISWKEWQHTQPIEEVYTAWFKQPSNGIGTLGGWNGKHYLAWIDFDKKDFDSGEECDRSIARWCEQFPVASIAPYFRTPSGGYRFLVAFNQEPENFKANSGFSLSPDGSHHVGELLCKSGSHTLLPPTRGVNGEYYRWVQWSEYPPVIDRPEDIGLYPAVKPQKTIATAPTKTASKTGYLGENSLSDLLENQIYPRLTPEQAFNWPGHEFKQHGDKLKGNCPWHESTSGTAFYLERKGNSLLWRCPACNIGGSPIEYRHRLKGGNGSPKKKEFVELVQELANEVGVAMPAPQLKCEGGRSPNLPQNNNVVTHPTLKQLISKDELLKEIDGLIVQDLPRSELEAIIPELAKKCDRYPADIWKLYNARVKEQEQAENREFTKKQLPSLLDAQKARLNPYELFWGDGGKFAHILLGVAQSMPTAVEHLITTLIPAAGSRIGTSARIVVNPRGKYTQPAIFWSCIVAPTGQLKSPSQQVILSALNKLETEEYKLWKAENDHYKRKLSAYQKSKDKDSEPPEAPPPRRRYIISNSTSEARIKIHAENPKGLLNFRDEWSAFINGRNKYRKGSGDDLEQDLSEFNGDVLSKDLVKSEEGIYLERSAISRTGNTQPEMLRKLQSQNNFEDFQGEFSRWLFCLIQSAPAYLDLFKDDDGLGDELDNQLRHLYTRLGLIPEQDYFLDDDGKTNFQAYQHQLINWSLEETHPGLKATYPKLQSYIARLALWLHLVNSVLAQEDKPSQFINGHTVAIACELVHFYLAQAKLMYAINSSQHELAGNYLKVKHFVERKKHGVTAREIKSGIFALKSVPSSEIQAICRELVELGAISHKDKKYYPVDGGDDDVDVVLMKYEELQNSQTAYISPVSPITEFPVVDDVDELLITHQQDKTLVKQELQNSSVDVVDEISPHINLPTGVVEDGLNVDVNEKSNLPINNINTKTRTLTQQVLMAIDPTSTYYQQPSTPINNTEIREHENLTQQVFVTVDATSTKSKLPPGKNFQEVQEAIATGEPQVLHPASSIALASQQIYKEGDRVEFKHPDSCDTNWLKGRIDHVDCQQGYFISYKISYLQRGKNQTCKLYRQDWVRC